MYLLLNFSKSSQVLLVFCEGNVCLNKCVLLAQRFLCSTYLRWFGILLACQPDIPIGRSCAKFVNADSNLIRIVFPVNYWPEVLILAIITLVSILNHFCLQLGVNPAGNDPLPLAIVGFPQSFQLRYRFGLAERDS